MDNYWNLNWQEALSIIFAILFSMWLLITCGFYEDPPFVSWINWMTDGIGG
ncbi:hypothetical protein LCGC14_2002760 [marine sediment metagenome]|uniref:Uncharacterized protein n=1 Tax=marine sediment metagenome TaxID=412755 RepID=A0A0F9F2N9_9ZZZZ